ncbi:hypothetical protein STEG23_007582, partial [Scotinomys teguina]
MRLDFLQNQEGILYPQNFLKCTFKNDQTEKYRILGNQVIMIHSGEIWSKIRDISVFDTAAISLERLPGPQVLAMWTKTPKKLTKMHGDERKKTQVYIKRMEEQQMERVLERVSKQKVEDFCKQPGICLPCMYVCVTVLDPLELELQSCELP